MEQSFYWMQWIQQKSFRENSLLLLYSPHFLVRVLQNEARIIIPTKFWVILMFKTTWEHKKEWHKIQCMDARNGIGSKSSKKNHFKTYAELYSIYFPMNGKHTRGGSPTSGRKQHERQYIHLPKIDWNVIVSHIYRLWKQCVCEGTLDINVNTCKHTYTVTTNYHLIQYVAAKFGDQKIKGKEYSNTPICTY